VLPAVLAGELFMTHIMRADELLQWKDAGLK